MCFGFLGLCPQTPITRLFGVLQSFLNVMFLTSDNEFSGIIYRLFRGMQNIFLTIFSICRKMCNKNFENQLTKSYVQKCFAYSIGRPLSSVSVCVNVCMYYACQHFQTSSPLKPLGRLKPNFI